VLVFAQAAQAEEGMWTFDDFPSKTVGTKYGFTPSQDWLDHVRLSSLRIAGGCSASFISPEGLVMTNHHLSSDAWSRFRLRSRIWKRTAIREDAGRREKNARISSSISWLRFAM